MYNKAKIIAAMLSLSCSAMATATLSENGAIEAYVPYVKENVAPAASSYKDNAYAHSPATVYHNGAFHQFYCSTGNLTDRFYDPKAQAGLVNSWDHIRYRYSKNGSDWSSPFIVLSASPTTKENRACDPAIVYDERDGYWYLFYQGSIDSYGGAIYVSRSKNIAGPYQKYTDQGWVSVPSGRAYPLLQKWTGRTATDPTGYGIGQMSIVRQGGKFHVWVNHMMRDDFVVYNSSNERIPYTKRYHIVVDNILDLITVQMGNFYYDPTDPRVHFVKHTQADSVFNDRNEVVYQFPANSEKWHFTDFGEVRWNEDAERFEMWVADRSFGYMMRIKKYHSTDGYNWTKDNRGSNSYNVRHQNDYMSWIHNIGVSGDKFGHIRNDQYLLSFSAPRNSGYYDDAWLIYNGYTMQDPATGTNYPTIARGIWSMWEILNGANWEQYNINYNAENQFNANTSARLQFFVGDFDGDGIDELGAVEVLRTKKFKWYIGSSKSPNGHSPIWGVTLYDKDYRSYQIISGDYDGDGKTDFGVVTFENGKSYWNIHSSKTGNTGVDHIPADFMVPQISENFTILSGDYNGDGKAELAAFEASSKKWYMRSSIDGSYMNLKDIAYSGLTASAQASGYIENSINSINLKPMVGDFDGDNITDLVLADTIAGAWYIRSSHGKYAMETGIYNRCRIENWPLYMQYYVLNCEQYPGNDDFYTYHFTTGDFDGDGIADKFIIQWGTGSAMSIVSRGGLHNYYKTFTKARINSSDPLQFLVGDFDGNGYSDLCIANRRTHQYYIAFFDFEGAAIKIEDHISRPIKYVNFSSSYPLAKKAVKPAKPEIAQEKAMPSFDAYVQDQKLVVSNTLAGQKVFVFDMRGKEISRKVSNGLDMTFDIPNKGMYVVRSGDAYRKISIK